MTAADAHQYQWNDEVQILLHVARYRDGEIANRALDAAIQITGHADDREAAYARSLTDRDIHQIIQAAKRKQRRERVRQCMHRIADSIRGFVLWVVGFKWW